jgi:hypothetical protein
LRSDGVNVVLGVFKALCILGGERAGSGTASMLLSALDSVLMSWQRFGARSMQLVMIS